MNSHNNMSKCKVFGHDIAYSRTGTGETVLLVHGITTYSFIWRKIIPLLIGKFEVIAVDLLGCGESDKPLDTSYSIKRHSEILREMMQKLGVQRLHLVGHDVGGGVAQIFAVMYPEMLRTLTLINSVAYDFWPVQPIIAMRTPIVRQFAMATLDLGAFRLIVRHGLYHKHKLTDELMQYFWKPMQTSLGRKAFLHFAKCLDNRNLMDIADALRTLPMPVLIVRGDGDPYLGSEISERLHQEIPGSKLLRIATGSHYIQEDEPERVVTAMLDAFAGEKHA